MTINTVNSGYQPSNIEMSEVKKAESNNRFVDKLKKACTNILNKLGFFKAKSLSNTQTSSLELRKVTMRFDKEVSVEIDVDASINLKKIKEIWQAGLIKVRQTKGEEAWANAVVDNLKKDSTTFDQMFSKENGIFNIDKLTTKELSAFNKAISKYINEKENKVNSGESSEEIQTVEEVVVEAANPEVATTTKVEDCTAEGVYVGDELKKQSDSSFESSSEKPQQTEMKPQQQNSLDGPDDSLEVPESINSKEDSSQQNEVKDTSVDKPTSDVSGGANTIGKKPVQSEAVKTSQPEIPLPETKQPSVPQGMPPPPSFSNEHVSGNPSGKGLNAALLNDIRKGKILKPTEEKPTEGKPTEGKYSLQSLKEQLMELETKEECLDLVKDLMTKNDLERFARRIVMSDLENAINELSASCFKEGVLKKQEPYSDPAKIVENNEAQGAMQKPQDQGKLPPHPVFTKNVQDPVKRPSYNNELLKEIQNGKKLKTVPSQEQKEPVPPQEQKPSKIEEDDLAAQLEKRMDEIPKTYTESEFDDDSDDDAWEV